MRDNFCIQNLHLQNLLGPPVIPEKYRHLQKSRTIFVYGRRLFHKLSKDNPGVNSVPVRQDLFDRIEVVERNNQKISKKPFELFDNDYKDDSTEEKLGCTRKLDLLETIKKLSKAEGLRRHSTVSNTKGAFAECTSRTMKCFSQLVPGGLLIKVLSQIVTLSHCSEIQQIVFERLDAKECQQFRLFVHSVQQATTRK